MKATPTVSTILFALSFSLIALQLDAAGKTFANRATIYEDSFSNNSSIAEPLRPSTPRPNVNAKKNSSRSTTSAASASSQNKNGPSRNSNASKGAKTPTAEETVVDTGASDEGGAAINAVNSNNAKLSATPTPVQSPTPGADEGGWLSYLLSWVVPVLIGSAAMAAVGFLIWGIARTIANGRENLSNQFGSVKKRQEELARQMRDSVAALSKDFNSRLAELQTEVRDLRVILQDNQRAILDGVRRSGTVAAPSYASYQGYTTEVKKEPQAFPVAADEYLSKMKRGAIVVKSDFQNGILVQDSDENGEFVLVRDYSAPDELLYVVPKVGYFQTKQDFYTYYDKYYECTRPAAGTVWVVQPAVVDKVSGGWMLREKGELEVK